ncbi:hypothetical protein VNO78_28008 [Psophocarpus tetragonolobus]|uniref:Cytochrome P450 n=1 Tax=Psophocarpus tetragonolobus TaxID=3891 RepID=A0AAN9S3U4_PSOTE
MKEMNTEIACIRLGNVQVIPVACPTIACKFLRKHDADFASRPLTMATYIISSGYMTIAIAPFGEQWKKTRRIFDNDLFSPLGTNGSKTKGMKKLITSCFMPTTNASM